jgi:hypothetical protein
MQIAFIRENSRNGLEDSICARNHCVFRNLRQISVRNDVFLAIIQKLMKSEKIGSL